MVHHARQSRWLPRLALAALAALALGFSALPRASADGGAPNLAYVAGGGPGGNGLVVIDVAKRQVTATIPVGGSPAAVVLSADGRFAYVTQSAGNGLAVVDASAKKVVATIPVGREPQAVAPCPSQAGNTLCVPLAGDDALAVVDPDNRRVVATIPVGHRPTGVGVAPAGSGILGSNPNDSEIYVANSASDSVSVISAQLRRVIATIAVPGGPVSVVVPGTGGGVAYVGTRAGSVVALSLANHVVLGTLLPAGAGPVGQMDYDAVTGQIYAPRPADGAVAVLRPASDTGAGANAPMPAEPVRTLPFPGGPAAVAITFDGALGFVVERDTGRVAMLDVAAHRTLTTIDVGGAPRGVITGAYPPLLGRQQANVIGFVILGALIVVLLIGFISIERHSRRAARERQQKQQQQADAERPRAQPPGGTA